MFSSCPISENVIEDSAVFAEQDVLKGLDLEALRAALSQLDDESYILINELYLAKNRKTESEMARLLGCSQVAVHKRKKKILRRLKFLVIKSQKSQQQKGRREK